MYIRSLGARVRALLALCALGLGLMTAGGALAVPAFAVQTGEPCQGCHVGGFGPQLTPFGRAFKISGYTIRTNKFNIPLSAMAVASYVRTQSAQPGPPPEGYNTNNNFAVDQVSVFLAGGLGSHLGAFVQTTYDGIAHAFSWDNLDVRATTQVTVKGAEATLGLSVNNSPTVQDPFNTLPAWGYPYTASDLAPSPAAAPMIGNLAQSTLGMTASIWLNSELWVEAGGYESPGSNFLIRAGADPTDPGNINGVAPYVRIAFQKNYGGHNFEVGAFGFWPNIYPGHDESTGMTDNYADLGLDGSFQLFAGHNNTFTVNGRYTHESQTLNASQALGAATNLHDTLQDLRLDASYYWHGKVGATVGVFDTWGSTDPLLYADNSALQPDSSGMLFQIDGTPWGDGGSPLGARFNTRVGLQYTAYFRFDGSSQNYDGFGRSAADNNTFRAFVWVAY